MVRYNIAKIKKRGLFMNVVLNKLNTIASYAAAISLVIILLVTSVSINCFDSDFYKSEYKTLQTAQV